jgi:acyl carrier protein phosphodiesterase
MISDYVKGKKKFDYPPDIQKGIMLHRAIDTYTDLHEATKEAKKVFRPVYRLNSGAFVDVVYDHFLATDENYFTKSSLYSFSQQVYSNIDQHLQWLVPKFAIMYPYMKEHNWLYNYRTRWGIEKSMGGVARRAVYLHNSKAAFELFEQHYQLLQDCSRQFLTAVIPFAENLFKELVKEDRKDL